MKTTYTLNFIDTPENNLKQLTDVPSWCKWRFGENHNISHYSASQTDLIIQTLETNHFTLDLAQMKSNLKKRIHLSKSQHTLLIIMVLKGSFTVTTPNSFMIGNFKSGNFYLVYSRRSEYILMNQNNNTEIVFIELKKKWLKKMTDHQALGAHFIQSLLSDDALISVLPGCKILLKHYKQLKIIYKYLTNNLFNYMILDAMLWLNVARAIEDYLHLLKHKETSLIFQVKHYIEFFFADPDISLLSIATHFGISQRRLQDNFKNTFSQSLYKYITERRMLYAHKLITEQGHRPADVYPKVGFKNPEVFRYHYRKYFPK